MGTRVIGGKPMGTGLFLRMAMFLGLFLSFGAATAFAGNFTVTNTDPAAVVGTKVADFTITIDVAAAADVEDGETVTVTLPANFPQVAIGDANDDKLGASVSIGGHAGADCGGDDGVTCSVDTRTLTVTIADVSDMDGGLNALTDGDDIVITFTAGADDAGTATITYEDDWSPAAIDFGGTHAGTYNVAGVTNITTDPQSAVNTVMVLTLSNPAAGATNTTTLNLDIPVDLDVGDTVAFTAPANLNVSGVDGAAATQTFDVGGGATFTCVDVGQTVTCTSSGNIDVAAGGESANIVMSGITAAYVSAAGTATDLVVTDNDSSGRIAIDDANLMLDATTIGDLTSTNVEPASLIVGRESVNTVTFTTTARIPSGGKIKVTYPNGWDVSDMDGLTAGGLSGLDGTWTASVSGQVITLTQSGGSATSAGTKSLTLSRIVNTSTAGNGGTYTILTEIAAGNDIETDAAVTTDVILSGTANVEDPDLDPLTGIAISKVATGIEITWTESTGDESTHVDILRGKNNMPVSGTSYALVAKELESYIDTDVEVGDTVKYILRPTNGRGDYGDLSEEFTITVSEDGEIEVVSEEVSEEAVEDIAEATEEAAANEEVEVAEEEGAGSGEFTDIAGHWGAERIAVMAGMGIVKGDPNGEFRPDDSLNRAEAAALLHRVLGMEEAATPGEKPFSDVEVGTWYSGYVSVLKGLELVNGNPDGTYKPGANINRAEFLHLALNVYYYMADDDVKAMIDGVRAGTENPFVDVSGDAYYVSTVRVASQMEFVEGVDCEGGKCFNPASDITRAEATKILYEMFVAE